MVVSRSLCCQGYYRKQPWLPSLINDFWNYDSWFPSPKQGLPLWPCGGSAFWGWSSVRHYWHGPIIGIWSADEWDSGRFCDSMTLVGGGIFGLYCDSGRFCDSMTPNKYCSLVFLYDVHMWLGCGSHLANIYIIFIFGGGVWQSRNDSRRSKIEADSVIQLEIMCTLLLECSCFWPI